MGELRTCSRRVVRSTDYDFASDERSRAKHSYGCSHDGTAGINPDQCFAELDIYTHDGTKHRACIFSSIFSGIFSCFGITCGALF